MLSSKGLEQYPVRKCHNFAGFFPKAARFFLFCFVQEGGQ